ncbi:MAG: glycosyltransferase family 39 protein [Kiritimatiellae bacterium]|nr:glycosyltransferase family 39 protein [Kiritimatiellia bacterium]
MGKARLKTQSDIYWAESILVHLKKCPNWVLCFGLSLWALIIRLLAAGKVFPAQGDASHFVQHGKAYLATGMDAISGYWSLLPQFLTAWSVKLGWMPQFVLQATTVAFGVLLVAGVYALAIELTRRQSIAVAAGLLIATNPVLTASSTSGLSETPHMALATWALVLAFAGARKRRAWLFALAGAVASVDMYYRPYDLFLYLVGAAPFILWRLKGNGWKNNLALIGAGVLVGAVCSMPFFVITGMKSAGSVGTSKLSNLAYGEDGLNAKAMYAAKGLHGEETPFAQRIRELQERGAWGYMWAHKNDVAGNYVRNVMRGIRNLNGHMFTGMFHMGLFWFGLLGVLFVMALGREHCGWVALYAICSMGVILAALSLGFVHPRWVMQFMPFYVLLVGGGFAWLMRRLPNKKLQMLMLVCLVLLGLFNGRWAVARLDDEWKQRNLFPVCERLHELMGEDERLMCFHPELPALFYKTNALNWVNIPFDSVEDVFALANAENVDCIVLHDGTFPHFPIHEIERHPEMIPAPWQEIDCMKFEQETRFELERDVYRVYRCNLAVNAPQNQ